MRPLFEQARHLIAVAMLQIDSTDISTGGTEQNIASVSDGAINGADGWIYVNPNGRESDDPRTEDSGNELATLN